MRKQLIAGALTAATLALPAAASGPVAFDGAWKTQRFSLFSANTYGFQGNSVSVASNGSVSLAYKALPESFWGASGAKWSWSVSQSVPATDLRKKGGDDRNLAMYFVFLPEDEAQRLKGANVRKLLTNDKARVLVYVWGGSHNRGSVLGSPYLGSRGKTIVLRGAGTGNANENVNLGQDYARAFGGGSAALVGLALSGDSDDTSSAIKAKVSGLRIQ